MAMDDSVPFSLWGREVYSGETKFRLMKQMDVYSGVFNECSVKLRTDMTKLREWLTVLILLTSIWLALLTEKLPLTLSIESREIILYMPIYFLITFACYSLGVVGYRVATFNDCSEASEELQRQIQEAKADLSSKGFKF